MPTNPPVERPPEVFSGFSTEPEPEEPLAEDPFVEVVSESLVEAVDCDIIV